MSKNNEHFSFFRLWAVMRKEFTLMRRDRLTFAILLIIPMMQLIMFGYAINTNPKYLPTAVIAEDHSPFTRAFLTGLTNTEYFSITAQPNTEKAGDDLLARGDVLFVVTIPSDFTRNLIRGDHPQIVIDADATDPVATSSALGAIPPLVQTIFNPLFVGNLSNLQTPASPVDVVLHAKYNPEAITSYNIVPGLLGVVLTMMMVMVTCLSITKEREIGTMETLLSTPIKPLEVMIGKIAPMIIVGYIQVLVILMAAVFLFHVPISGSIWLLLLAALPFIAANLSVGVTFSSLAQNQLQSVQMTMFFFLPSMLISGFMFPFYGMPQWAQWIGSILPLTHFLRIVRGIMLKGNDFAQIWPEIWPILIFMVVVIIIGARVYRRTLD
jgi:ABC-2 type transport system permease protein